MTAKLIGNNEMLINEATVIAAVQMLLDSSHKDGCAPKVTSVRWDGDTRGARDGAFRCVLSEKKPEAGQ
ncbi:MAG: hypothetical protein LCH39_01890 [Proteobacteria bacterium]|nr:hypothetical protein [Pseudomonadota bacterium]